jgi:hypothetical protein
MKKSDQINREPKTEAVYLASRAVKRITEEIPKGSRYFIVIVLIGMMTGRLVANKGSLARTVQPLIWGIKWGWHRVHRAMSRGKVEIDEMIEKMNKWCEEELELEEIRIGKYQREVIAIDSSTVARLRSGEKLELAGKQYWSKVKKAVKANVLATASKIVMIKGIRMGLVQKIRYGNNAKGEVEKVFNEVEKTPQKQLILVDAGIATKEQFSKASENKAILGRLRINQKLRCEPIKIKGKRGRPPLHGEIIHPGKNIVEVVEDEKMIKQSPEGEIIIRRWNKLHFEEYPKVKIDVLRVDDPKYKKPLLVGTVARELTTEEFYSAYPMRWPVETNYFVAQDTTAMDMPRAWTKNAIERRIGLSLITGSILQAISASCESIAVGPWDSRATPSAGRLAKFLDLYSHSFLELSLDCIAPRNYSKIPITGFFNNLRSLWAA